MKKTLKKLNKEIDIINEVPVKFKTKTNKLSIALATVALVTLNGVAVSSVQAGSDHYNFKVIEKLGDPADGGGTHEGDFEPQAINNAGNVMLVSDLSLGSEGLFLSRKGVESRVIGPGMPAPGTSDSFGGYGILGPGGMNDKSDMVVSWTRDIGFSSYIDILKSAGIWRYDAAKNRLNKIFVAGDKAPGGTTFRGASYSSEINNRGMVVAVGLIDTDLGVCQDSTYPCYGLGLGVYVADNKGKLSKIVAPGDRAPGWGHKTFDSAESVSINDRGDVAFGAHVTGEDCIGFDPQFPRCFTSEYLYRASTHKISSIAHQGDRAPGGGYFNEVYGGRINNGGDMVYIGNISATPPVPGVEKNLGVFLTDRRGVSRAIARHGDKLPGGTMDKASFTQAQVDINDSGIVAFAALLVEDENLDGFQDTGVYVNSGGKNSTVVRTGTVIPGLGTVAHVNLTYYVGSPNSPVPYVSINASGKVMTQVILENGDNYVIVASPHS